MIHVVVDGEFVMKMHALASQGRLKDVSRDVVHELERSHALSELSVAGSSAGVGERTLSSAVDSYVDYVTSRCSSENTTWLKNNQQDDMPRTSDVPPPPAALQRLEQLEASLNHARRRLAIDDDDGADRSSSNAARYIAVMGPTTESDSGQGDVNWSADNSRNDYVGDLNMSPWISPSFHDVAALQRRQMCGGSVLSTSAAVVTSCLQTSPLTSSTLRAPGDVVSSRATFTNSRLHGSADDGGGSPSKWCGRPLTDARTLSDIDNAVESAHELGNISACPRTPGKREPPSTTLDSAVEHLSTPVNDPNRLTSHFALGMCCRPMVCIFMSDIS